MQRMALGLGLAGVVVLLGCVRGTMTRQARGGTAASAPAPHAGEAAASQPASLVANTEYQAWADFPVGTAIRRATLRDDGSGTRVETYHRLKADEVSPEHVVLQERIETVVVEEGRRSTSRGPWVRRVVPAKVDPAASAPASPAGAALQGEETTRGTEVLTIGGREYATGWVIVRVQEGERVTYSRTWSSAAMPGGLVKRVDVINAPGQKRVNVTTEVLDVELAE